MMRLFAQPDYEQQQVSVERLARRLNVQPHTEGFAYLVQGQENRAYSITDLMHALLDRLAPDSAEAA
jgi:hypothetical protein